MVTRSCTFLLFFIFSIGEFTVVAQDDEDRIDNDPFLDNKKVSQNHIQDIGESDVKYAAFFSEKKSSSLQIHCDGPFSLAEKIQIKRNSIPVSCDYIDEDDTKIRKCIYQISNDDDALYECNGIELWIINKPEARAEFSSSVWSGTTVSCINPGVQEESGYMNTLKKVEKNLETTLSVFTVTRTSSGNNLVTTTNMFPIVQTKVSSDATMKCNRTDSWNFESVALPTTELVYEGKKVICRSSDNAGRCKLSIYFGDEIKAQGMSPELKYPYKSINIQTTRCESECTIDGTTEILPLQEKEINRPVFSAVIAFVVIFIIILIIVVFCIVWRYCGFKEKYGYKVNMRLNKSFNVDNKFSSYRLSGVEADGAAVDSDEDDDEVRNEDKGSIIEDDSFADPNYGAHGKSSDYSRSTGYDQPENQKPFLRI